MIEDTRKKNIVILGAGFAGVYAYLGLHARFHGKKECPRIVLVSEYDYFLFLTLLHEVATGNILPASIIHPIRTLPSCCLDRFVEGRATDVDLDAQTVHIKEKEHSLSERSRAGTGEEIELSYDYLISALGSETNFFGVSGASEYAYTLKNLDDAKRIKNRVIDSFEAAERLSEEKEIRDQLRFVVVGGGPTGVELAGELADYINDELYRVYPHVRGKAEILLAHAGDRLVPQMDAWFDRKIRDIFTRKFGIALRLHAVVERISKTGITIAGEEVRSHTVVWAAGVKAREVDFRAQRMVEYEEKTKRVKVNNHLQLPSYTNCFVVGDQAWIFDKEQGVPYPMRAQFATKEGDAAAENIARLEDGRPCAEFEWKDLGFILSLGKGGALANILGMHVSGPLAWFLHRIVYITKIVGIRAKMRTALEWTLNLFTARDITRI